MYSSTIKKISLAAILLGASLQHSDAQTKTKDDSYFEISKNLDIYYALFKEVNEYYVDPIQPGKMVKKKKKAPLLFLLLLLLLYHKRIQTVLAQRHYKMLFKKLTF